MNNIEPFVVYAMFKTPKEIPCYQLYDKILPELIMQHNTYGSDRGVTINDLPRIAKRLAEEEYEKINTDSMEAFEIDEKSIENIQKRINEIEHMDRFNGWTKISEQYKEFFMVKESNG